MIGEVGLVLVAPEQEAPVQASERWQRDQELVLHPQVVEQRTEGSVGVRPAAGGLRVVEQRGVVTGPQRARAAVLAPELLPEQRQVFVGRPDDLFALHPAVVHAQRPDPLLGDVHELEGDVEARDQLAQAGEDVGVEDVVVGRGSDPIENVQQGAEVIRVRGGPPV